jgi:hypothetical protein
MKYSFKVERGSFIRFPHLAAVYTDNPSINPSLYITALEGHFEITISLIMHSYVTFFSANMRLQYQLEQSISAIR